MNKNKKLISLFFFSKFSSKKKMKLFLFVICIISFAYLSNAEEQEQVLWGVPFHMDVMIDLLSTMSFDGSDCKHVISNLMDDPDFAPYAFLKYNIWMMTGRDYKITNGSMMSLAVFFLERLVGPEVVTHYNSLLSVCDRQTSTFFSVVYYNMMDESLRSSLSASLQERVKMFTTDVEF